MPNQVEKFKAMAKLITEFITRKEFIEAFAVVVKYVKNIKDTNQKEFDAIHKAFQVFQTHITEEKDSSLLDLKERIDNILQSQIDAVTAKLTSITQPKDGKDADETTIIAEVLKQLPPYPIVPEQLLGEDFRNALESLQGDDRLDATAVKNLPELAANTFRGVLTATALYSLADVNVAGITAGQSILWNGQQWIPFTPASGTGGYQQPTSGVVNGINTVFVFATAPNILSVDGGRNIQKVSSDGTQNWTGTTNITLSVAPNFDVFAVG